MKLVVFSGGTATNSLLDVYASVASQITYVLPISDNGGSTSEIIRVIGGPAIGDIRSRVVKLIPESERGLYALFSHRLDQSGNAKQEWTSIVDGNHELWNNIDPVYREMIRPFFIHVHVEILKRGRPGHEFSFERASVGNLFLSGVRLFCGSLDSAIELMCKITSVPDSCKILPAINTNFMHHIAAELDNGDVIMGQSQISHPSDPVLFRYLAAKGEELVEDANLPFTHPDLASSQLYFSKDAMSLDSPIKRVFYINPFGQEIKPRSGSRVIASLKASGALMYSIGSLYTSTIPLIILKDVGDAIKKVPIKVLLLNGDPDRETSGMNAMDYIAAIVKACMYSQNQESENDENNNVNWAHYVTHLIYLETVTDYIAVDVEEIQKRGVKCISVGSKSTLPNTRLYDEASLITVLQRILA